MQRAFSRPCPSIHRSGFATNGSTTMNTKHKRSILGVITARGGSKGIPGKNIKLLDGKPLIAWTIEAAKKSRYITHLIVSTDNAEIAKVAKKYGTEIPFMRPRELAEEKTPHVPVMQHAVRFMEDKLNIVFDAAVILQPTSPFRTPDDIDGTIAKLFEYPEATSAVSVCELTETHPIKVKKMEGDRVLPYGIPEPEGGRRQDLPTAYKRSSAVYVMKRKTLIEDNRLYGDYVVGHIVPTERSIDIDTSLDWVKAEWMLQSLA